VVAAAFGSLAVIDRHQRGIEERQVREAHENDRLAERRAEWADVSCSLDIEPLPPLLIARDHLYLPASQPADFHVCTVKAKNHSAHKLRNVRTIVRWRGDPEAQLAAYDIPKRIAGRDNPPQYRIPSSTSWLANTTESVDPGRGPNRQVVLDYPADVPIPAFMTAVTWDDRYSDRWVKWEGHLDAELLSELNDEDREIIENALPEDPWTG
jgi:hypothetical protein